MTVTHLISISCSVRTIDFGIFSAGTPLIFQIFGISTAGPSFPDPRLDPSVPSPSGSGTLDDPLHGGGGADVQTYSYSSSTQQITVSDEEGSLQWTEKDGLRFLRATDLEGRVLFEGAITTEEDRKKMPDGVGQRLRAMQQSGQIPAN